MTRAISFESFADPELEAQLRRKAARQKQAAPPPKPEDSPLYQLGYDAGCAAAAEAFAAEAATAEAARRELAEAIAASRAERDDIEAEVAGRAAMLLRQVAVTLAPRIAAQGFAEEAAAAIRDWMARAVQGRAELRVSPERAERMRRELGPALADAEAVSLVEDPGLGANAARMTWVDGLAEIDLDRAVERVTAALEAFAPAPASVDGRQETSHDVE